MTYINSRGASSFHHISLFVLNITRRIYEYHKIHTSSYLICKIRSYHISYYKIREGVETHPVRIF